MPHNLVLDGADGTLGAFVDAVIHTTVTGARKTGSGIVTFFGYGTPIGDDDPGRLVITIQHSLSFDNVSLEGSQGYGRLGATSQVTAFVLNGTGDINGVEDHFRNPNAKLFTQSRDGSDIAVSEWEVGLGYETTNLLDKSGAADVSAMVQVADGAAFGTWSGDPANETVKQNVELLKGQAAEGGSLDDFVATIVTQGVAAAGQNVTGATVIFSVGCYISPANPSPCGGVGAGGGAGAGVVVGDIAYTNAGDTDGQIGAVITSSVPTGNTGGGITSGLTITGTGADLGTFTGDITSAITTSLTEGGASQPGAATTGWVIVGTKASGTATYVSPTV
jgi:hypothetical protein